MGFIREREAFGMAEIFVRKFAKRVSAEKH